MKKRRKNQNRGAAVSLPVTTDIREFARSLVADYRGDDLGRVMRQIVARHTFADEPPENLLIVFIRRVAVIVGKTYAERGDDAQLADDLALMLIRDLLLQLDPEIIDRHRNRKLPSPRAMS
jgi:hypothetical protein